MATEEFQRILATLGVHALAPRVAAEVLGHLLGCASPQIAYVDVDWKKFKAVYEAKKRRPLLALMAEAAEEDMAAPRRADSGFAARLESAPAADRASLLVVYLQETVAGILRLEEGLPDPEIGFFQLGMDSLMAVELRNRVSSGLGIPLPSTLAFDFPTMRDLATYILSEHFAAPVAEADEPGAAARAEVSALNEAEVSASIQRELSELNQLLAGEV